MAEAVEWSIAPQKDKLAAAPPAAFSKPPPESADASEIVEIDAGRGEENSRGSNQLP